MIVDTAEQYCQALGQKKKSLVSGPPLAEKMRRASDIFFYFVIFFLLKLVRMSVKSTRENDDVTTGRGS